MKVEPAKKIETLEFLSKLGLGVRATNVLLRMGLESVAEVTALDEKTLLRWRNCGKKTAAEIIEAVMRYKPPVEVPTEKRMDAMSLSAAMERMPVTDLRLSVRALGGLEHLKISTVGQLARVSDQELLSVRNFGRNSLCEVQSQLALLRSRGFVLWPVEQQTAHDLNQQNTRAARKLYRLKSASTLTSDDPRFGHLVQELGLGAKNAREAAGLIVSRKADPIYLQPLMLRLADLTKAVKASNQNFLEAELWNLTDGLGNERNRQIIVSHLGWDGKPPRTLEAVSQTHGMTRERVRQICKPIEKYFSLKPFVPVLDRALKTTARAAPATAQEIESRLVQSRLTKSGFCVEALIAAARQLGRDPQFDIETLHGYCVVVPASNRGILNRVDQVARAAISHWGVANVEDAAAATGVAISLTQKVLPLLSGFKWLDEPSGWFWIADTPRNTLLTQIRKILVASPSIDVGELRTGVGRHHRKKGFAPPRRVLLELCRQLPWCRADGEKIMSAAPQPPSEILSNAEQIILRVLKEHGPVLQRAKFEQLCLEAGMNNHTFWVLLSYCPLICRHASGVYGLRGAEVPVGLVESLVPKRTEKSKLLVDYGWTKNRNIRILYRVSNGMLSNGIVSIPAAFKTFVQGRFALITGDDSKIGTLVVKDNSAWGLGPFFARRGGEPGDYLLMMFDLSQRNVAVQVGDSSFADQLDTSDSSVPQSDGSEIGDASETTSASPARSN